MKQLTRIFLSIILLLGICGQISLGQETKTKEDVCAGEIFPLYKAYFEEKTNLQEKTRKAKLLLEKLKQPGCESEDLSYMINKSLRKLELREIRTKCVDSDKAYFSKPDLANLNSMISACGAWLEKAPIRDYYFPTRLGIATGFGSLAGFYKDIDQTFSFAEKALESLKEETVPREWKESDWHQFRRENIGRLLQYQGFCKLRQSQPDYEQGIVFLTKSAELKNSPAYRDTNTYLLRAETNMAGCSKINEVLEAKKNKPLPSEKSLREVCPVVEQVIQDYARVAALLALWPIDNVKNYDVREELTRLWNVTYPNSSRKKLNDLINIYKAEFSRK